MIGKKTRRFRTALTSLLLPLLLLAFAGPALAEVVGRVSRVEGAVDIMPGGELPAVAAREGAQVQQGDFVRTKSNARAEITFNDGSVVKIAQRSRIDVGEYSASNRRLALPRGKVQATVVPAAQGAARSFEIRTPNAIAGVRGTSFYVYHQANVTGVAVLSGVVQTSSLSAPSKPVTLVAGTATTVSKRSAPTPPRPATGKELDSHQKDVAPTGAKGGEPQAGAAGTGGENAGASSAPAGTSGSAASTGTATGDSGTSSESAAASSGTAGSATSAASGSTSTSSTSSAGTQLSGTGSTASAGADSSFSSETLAASLTALAATTVQPVSTPQNLTQQVVIPVTDTREDTQEVVTLIVATPPTDTTTPPPTDTTTPPPTGTTTPPPTGTTTPPPVFSSQLAGGLMSRGAAIDPNSNLLTIVSDPVFPLVISGATSLWSGSATAVLSGIYPTLPLQQPNHYWFGKFFSNSNATHTTADGGAYFGYFGGMSLDGTGVFDTNLSALYLDPTGKAGIMQGAMPGTVTAGTASGTGTLTLTEMNAGSGLNPATFAADWWNSTTGSAVVEVTGPVLMDSLTANDRNETEGFYVDAALHITGQMHERGDVLRLGYLAADPSFGIWTRESFGSYDGSGPQFVLISNAEWGTVNPDNTFTLDDDLKIISLGNWQAGALTGKADGVWGDLATGNIRLLTGTLTGSANPATSTFGATTTGSFIDLTRFIANPTLAAGLGFPTVSRTDSFTLSGNSSTGSVSLGTVTFYGRNAGDQISLWVAPNITGSYSGSLQQQTYSLLNGASPSTSTVMGSMRINGVSSSSNTWMGAINVIGETGSSFRSDFDGIAAGTLTGTTFTGSAAGLSHPVTYYSSLSGGLKRYLNGIVTSYGSVDGIMGGMSLWNGTEPLPSEFQGVGFLTPSQTLTDPDYVMSAPIRSQDIPSATAMTADGGAYQGHVVAGVSTNGGGPDSPGIAGIVNALSIDPSGNAGVLRGKVEGFLDPFNNIWRVDGDVIPVALEAATTVTAATLNSTGGVVDAPVSFGTGGTNFSGTLGLGGWAPETYSRSHIASSPKWGIGQFALYAPYSTPPAAGAPWNVDFTITDGSVANFKMVGTMAGQLWDPTSGKLGASTRAAWHDMLAPQPTENPMTGIFIGETVGTFNPLTLQAMTSGMWLETGKFLELVANNPAALQKLNIPAVEVGRASFTGSAANFDVTVNDMVFLAPVSGARPQLFASNNITGNYYVAIPVGSATLNQMVGSGVNTSGISPVFTMNQWDAGNNKWSATLQFNDTTGVVGGHGNVQFMGVAAGRSSGGVPGTFTGTGAGVVR